MHEQWQQQLSFYVAGLLSLDEQTALEQHLITCNSCREAVEEWRQLAHVVVIDVESRVTGLPVLKFPMARNGRYQIRADNVLPEGSVMIASLPVRAARSGSHTMVWLAAILVMILIGGAVLFRPGESAPHYGAAGIKTPRGMTPTPIPTQTIAPPVGTPLPQDIRLQGIHFEAQNWNNQGPATLSMALSYYGWTGNQATVAQEVKPNPEDKNVSPWELARYVNTHTDYKALYRMGGTISLLRHLLAVGFPVIVQTGFQPESEDWMGHYLLMMGYEDTAREFLVFDSYLGNNFGQGRPYPYHHMDDNWRHFNRTFIVVYQPDQEAALRQVLGKYVDPEHAAQTALQFARAEASKNPEDRWAWFNMGSSYVALGNYENAAIAFDKAFELSLPWRILWYQFGPYEAYFQVGRYEDVLNLAETNLNTTPYAEEAYYWQGMVYAAQDDTAKAVQQFEEALSYNHNFTSAREALDEIEESYKSSVPSPFTTPR